MKTNKIAINNYKYFSDLNGNEHVASEFALKTVLEIIKNYNPKNILELGLGIGSISYCVMDFSKKHNQKINYYGTEMNEFCLEALSKYLKEYYLQIQIFSSLKDVTISEKFDLVIIDGSDDNVKNIENYLNLHGIIIIEGDRVPQLNIIRNIYPNSLYTRVISDYKNPNYGPFSANDYSSGLQLIFVNPSLKQKIDYWFFKIQTAINYRKRAFKK